MIDWGENALLCNTITRDFSRISLFPIMEISQGTVYG